VEGGVLAAVCRADVEFAARTTPSRRRIHSADSCVKFGCDGCSFVPNRSGCAAQNATLVSALVSPCPAATSRRSAAGTRPAEPIADTTPGPPVAALPGGRTVAASPTSSVPAPGAGAGTGVGFGATGVAAAPPDGTARGILAMMCSPLTRSSRAS
jgi:hypothetical protein